MSKRKNQPTKLSLTNSDEESVKKDLGEFKAESDYEEDNGVFEDDAATELNSETEENTENAQQLSDPADAKRNQPASNHNAEKASSAMLNSLSQQAMKRKHKKFRPSESEENAENFTNNLNNGSSNLSSLMSLAMGNSQSAYDLFALSSMSNNNSNQQLLSTLARFASANNQQPEQPAVSKEHNQQTKNNGLFRRRKRSELDEDEDNEPKDEYNDLKATDQTASLLAAISSLQQPAPTANNNEQNALAQMVGQLTGGRKQPSDSDVKQENERKLLEVLRKCGLMLNQPSEVPNGNSLANGSAFNNLQLDIVS